MPQNGSKRSFLKRSKGLLVRPAFKERVPFQDLIKGESIAFIRSEIGHHFSALFRPLRDKAQRERRIVKWVWKFSEEKNHPGTVLIYDELEYEFACFEELGEDDLKIFLRLVALAGLGQVVLDPWMEEYVGPDGELVRQLSLFSEHPSRIENSRTMPVVRSSDAISYNRFFGPLLKGRVGKNHINQFERSLTRLSRTSVTITAKRNGKKVRRMGSSLVSYFLDYETGRVIIAVNPFIANALLGKPLGDYSPLIDSQIFYLKGTAAIVLSWLSAWLLPARSGKISLDKLEEHIYGDRAEDKNRRKWRRKKLRQALKTISTLKGWEIRETSRGIFEIRRLAPQSSKSERSETSPRARASSAS